MNLRTNPYGGILVDLGFECVEAKQTDRGRLAYEIGIRYEWRFQLADAEVFACVSAFEAGTSLLSVCREGEDAYVLGHWGTAAAAAEELPEALRRAMLR